MYSIDKILYNKLTKFELKIPINTQLNVVHTMFLILILKVSGELILDLEYFGEFKLVAVAILILDDKA